RLHVVNKLFVVGSLSPIKQRFLFLNRIRLLKAGKICPELSSVL
ncbi:unnamed protein product, partial [Allacma fusca]